MANKKILLVEDEIIIAMAEMAVLKKNHFDTIHANSGEEAIRILDQGLSVDLILMDFALGNGMSGAETAEEILKTLSYISF